MLPHMIFALYFVACSPKLGLWMGWVLLGVPSGSKDRLCLPVPEDSTPTPSLTGRSLGNSDWRQYTQVCHEAQGSGEWWGSGPAAIQRSQHQTTGGTDVSIDHWH